MRQVHPTLTPELTIIKELLTSAKTALEEELPTEFFRTEAPSSRGWKTMHAANSPCEKVLHVSPESTTPFSLLEQTRVPCATCNEEWSQVFWRYRRLFDFSRSIESMLSSNFKPSSKLIMALGDMLASIAVKQSRPQTDMLHSRAYMQTLYRELIPVVGALLLKVGQLLDGLLHPIAGTEFKYVLVDAATLFGESSDLSAFRILWQYELVDAYLVSCHRGLWTLRVPTESSAFDGSGCISVEIPLSTDRLDVALAFMHDDLPFDMAVRTASLI